MDQALIDDIFAQEWGRVLAALIGILGDFELAEDAAQEAFVRAAERWPRDGTPDAPVAWLVRTGRNVAIDLITPNPFQPRRTFDEQDLRVGDAAAVGRADVALAVRGLRAGLAGVALAGGLAQIARRAVGVVQARDAGAARPAARRPGVAVAAGDLVAALHGVAGAAAQALGVADRRAADRAVDHRAAGRGGGPRRRAAEKGERAAHRRQHRRGARQPAAA